VVTISGNGMSKEPFVESAAGWLLKVLTEKCRKDGYVEWAHQDLNLERPGYEPGTLTN
jgi:hypothetical protein